MGESQFRSASRVPLKDFRLDGRRFKHLRSTLNRLESEGCSFEIVPAESVPALLPELEQISSSWLEHKHTREKGFSLGRFDPAYLRSMPVAVVRQHGRIQAFANLWSSGSAEELSVELMRYRSEAPAGMMDYLFTSLMLRGQEQGFAWFNLGMAPLSGLDEGPHTTLWSRFGSAVWHHMEHFYNFQGLRQYKQKFDPVWEPRYLAAPGGLALAHVLKDVTVLVSGGLRGVVRH